MEPHSEMHDNRTDNSPATPATRPSSTANFQPDPILPTARRTLLPWPKQQEHGLLSFLGRRSPSPHSQLVVVPGNILVNATDNGLRKRFCTFLPRVSRRVFVESSPLCTPDSVFFAPHPASNLPSVTAVPAEFLAFAPDLAATPDLVRATDDFTLSFVGMGVPAFDFTAFRRARNDLLLYSVARPPHADGAAVGGRRLAPTRSAPTVAASFGRKQEDDATSLLFRQQSHVMDAALQGRDEPTIHYDPFSDGKGTGTVPNTFVTVPHSKAVFHRHEGRRIARQQQRGVRRGRLGGRDVAEVPVRFSVMEIDEVSPSTAKAVMDIGNFSDSLNNNAPGVPYASVVSSAVKIALDLGRKRLSKYAAPDHVMSVDMLFKLHGGEEVAAAGDSGSESEEVVGDSAREVTSNGEHIPEGAEAEMPRSNYLRYGYYYFLSEKVDAQLYAQTGMANVNARLLLRRTGPLFSRQDKSNRQLFPLSGVSYVVVKVSRGLLGGHLPSKLEREKSRRRLEHILSMGAAINELASIRK